MSLKQFIKLLLSNVILVIGLPLLMTIIVVVATADAPKSYTSKSTVYTGIVSGNNINNQPGVGGRYIAPSVFDNLKTLKESPALLKEVSLKLIARNIHLAANAPDSLSKDALEHFRNLFPATFTDSILGENQSETYLKLLHAYTPSEDNLLYKVLESKAHHYSLSALKTISFYRLKESDIIAFEYITDDPTLAQHTLAIFLTVFVNHYKQLKLNETGEIISYFERQAAEAFARLNEKERSLQQFREQNNILDYIEQVRAIALKKEDMESEYYNEKMALASAKKSVALMEEELNTLTKILETNQRLITARRNLELASSELAVAEVMNAANDQQMAALRTKVENARNEVAYIIQQNSDLEYTKSGSNTKQMLNKWLESIINVSQGEARLQVFDERKKAYEETYKTLSPLGGALTKLEREVNVAEQTYLSMLTSLNEAQLRKQNADLTTDLRIIDAPNFPLFANRSQRIVYVLLAIVLGLVLSIGAILILELADSTIKTPQRYAQQVKLPLAGIVPLMGKQKGVDYAQLMLQSGNLLITQLDAYLKPGNIIAIVGMQKGEGVDFVTKQLVQSISALGYDTEIGAMNGHVAQIVQSKSELLSLAEIQFNPKAIHLINLPALLADASVLKLLAHTDVQLLVTRANRNWSMAESTLLKTLISKSNTWFGVLNGVRLNAAEGYLGEIPRQRSGARLFLNRLFTLQFKGASRIA